MRPLNLNIERWDDLGSDFEPSYSSAEALALAEDISYAHNTYDFDDYLFFQNYTH